MPKVHSFSHRTTLIASLILLSGNSSWAKIQNPTEPYITYTVAQGDKLSLIASKVLNDPKQWNALVRMNGLTNPNIIRPGQEIDIPRSMINFNLQPKLANTGVLQSAHGNVTINGLPAQAGAPVPEGARVQTASGSSAVVKLSDGSTVQLMPRSLAEVVTQHGYAMKDPASSTSTTWFSGVVRLVEGALDIAVNKTAKRKEPMGVHTPTSTIGIRGTKFRVAFDDPKERTARTEVLEGKVRADNAVQKTGADVAGGFGVAIKPGEREVKVVPLLPALPESALPERVERTRDSQQALWTIAALGGAAGYRAELAQDPAFTQVVFDTKSNQTNIDLSDAPNGKYFARVRGFDASGIEGYNASRRIEITAAPAKLIWIQEINLSAIAEHTAGGAVLKFNTGAQDTPKALQVQVALDAAMTQAVQTYPIDPHGRATLKDIKPGERRFLRVVGTSAEGIAGNSAVLRLDLPSNWGGSILSLTTALHPIQ